MSKTRRTFCGIALTVIAAVFFVAALKLPLWRLRMVAPQYRDEEALRINVFAGSMTGDLREINVLNQYIGVHVPPVLPQSKWLPQVLVIGAVLGVLASVLPRAVRRGALILVPVALCGAMGFAIVQAKQQMHDIGHKRDAHTKMARVKNFDPPFLGTAKVAQFTITSWFGAGAYFLGVAIVLQGGAAFVSQRRCHESCCCGKSHSIPSPKPSEALA